MPLQEYSTLYCDTSEIKSGDGRGRERGLKQILPSIKPR